MLGRLMARQLSRPDGVLGRIVGRLMNRFNRDMCRAAIATLEVAPGDDVLEIGFGGGASLQALLTAAGKDGHVTGLDLSETMVIQAERRYARAVRDRQLMLRLGRVEHLPFTDESFDRVLTSNTIYFWPDAPRALAEIFRVLRPSGRLSFGFSPRSVLERGRVRPYGFIVYEEAQVRQLLRESGLLVTDVERHEHPLRGYIIVAAEKPGRAG